MNNPGKITLPDRIIHLVLFILFFFILCVSHRFDWDFFYTTFEVDLQGWLIDHVPPVWSYSFCGGSPRIADPQAFGLSPLFIFALLFGPVLGAKLLFLGLAILGYFSLKDLLSNLTSTNNVLISYLSLYFVLGYYFFWHAHIGNVTFALIYLWIAALALSVRLLLSPAVQVKVLLALVILITSGLTAGFYHSVVFFLVPVSIIFIPMLYGLKTIRLYKTGFYQVAAASGLGLVLSSYKWLAIIQHQLASPRSLVLKASTNVSENYSLVDTAIRLFVPTYHDQYWGGLAHTEFYGIWEYSTFSWNHVTLFLCLFLIFRKRIITNTGLFIASVALIIFGALLALGEFSSWAPFSLLNEHVLHHSLRVAGRFLLVCSLGITLLQAATVAGLDEKASRWFLSLQRCGILVFLLAPWSFYPGYQGPDWLSGFHYPHAVPEKRQAVIWLPTDEADNPTSMYPVTARGISVIDCYSPLFQERRVQGGGREVLTQMPFNQAFHFVKTPGDTGADVRNRCLGESYYTSSTVHLGKSCPAGSCLFLNSLAPDDPVRALLEIKNGLYCKVQTPSNERPKE